MNDHDFSHPGDSEASGESYYVSITDLLIGLLFIFIILLVFFAAQLRSQSEQIVSSAQTRSELLKLMAADMEAAGIPVQLDLPHGILRLSGDKLFEVGDRDPTDFGRTALAALSGTMSRHLPCYSFGPVDASGEPTGTAECPQAPPHTVDTVVIEGHTDSDPIRGTDWVRDNWDLSAARATSAYRLILTENPALAELRNAPADAARADPIFSAAGYADQRPVADPATAGKSANRRIDLRVVMAPPSQESLAPAAPDDLDWTRRGTAKELRLGQTLKFARGRTTDAHLGYGWSRPESWGAWSNGPETSLILPLKPNLRGRPLAVEVIGLAYVVESAPQRSVQVRVNGQLIDSWVFEHPVNEYARTLKIPAELTAGDTPMVISFAIENPVSPLSLGLSGDGRALGLAISSVRILRDPA